MESSEEEVYKIIQQAQKEGRLNPNEVLVFEEYINEKNTMIKVLRKENILMKENLPESRALDEEHIRCKKDAQDTIVGLEMQLNEMRITVNGLDKKMNQLGMDVVITEESKTNQLLELNHQWEEKFKQLDSQAKKVMEEVIKRHCDVKKEYESIIERLKEQIIQKEAEVAWCHLMIEERKRVIAKEVLNMKKELRVTTMKEQELLKKKMAKMENRANKMSKKFLRLQNLYQQKLSNSQREKKTHL